MTQVGRIVPYSIVLAAAAILYVAVGQFEYSPRPGRLGPDVWPRALLILMMIACAYEILRLLLNGGHTDVEGLLEVVHEESAEARPEVPPEGPAATYPHLLAGGIALTIGYVLLFDVIGFFLDTLLFMVLFMVVGRCRRPGTVLLCALAGSLAFMFVFMKIVYVSLPIGQAPFSGISLALMQLMGIR